ncbi:tyrosine-protein phosphatase [Metabacillus herbersteinensis]|uniref:Tyrosine-protein phosphatase n=1 Tax=Metabacillus herbersteinensis TaxID=283816 RepID=A0ABV6GFD6_9BACI
MIDIHSHILPGVDDGAQRLVDSIDMAKMAVEEGITKIIATPHHQNGKYTNKKADIIERVVELNHQLQKENIALEVLPGQETRIYGEILQDLEKDDILPLNHSNYLFVELPSGHVPRYTEQLLYDIQLKGLTPIIVHPERNAEVMENSDILFNLVNKGALTQVTAGSLTGHFGKKIQKFSMQLVEAQLTHFVASDVHNVSSRAFRLRDSYAKLQAEFGGQAVYYFQENAELVVQGLTVYRETPGRVKRKKILGIF